MQDYIKSIEYTPIVLLDALFKDSITDNVFIKIYFLLTLPCIHIYNVHLSIDYSLPVSSPAAYEYLPSTLQCLPCIYTVHISFDYSLPQNLTLCVVQLLIYLVSLFHCAYPV